MTIKRLAGVTLVATLGYVAGSLWGFGGSEKPVVEAQARTHWEHTFVHKPGAAVVDWPSGPKGLISLANGKGAKGWELCGVIRLNNDFVGFMKRPSRE
jgi:hypothetical protein